MAFSSLYVALLALILVIALIALIPYGLYHLIRFMGRTGTDNADVVLSSSTVNSEPTTSRSALDPKILASLPVFFYASSSLSNNEIRDCTVCLGEFTNGDKGILLQKCGHTFHEECISTWFKLKSTCPTCRSNVGPKSPKLSR